MLEIERIFTYSKLTCVAYYTGMVFGKKCNSSRIPVLIVNECHQELFHTIVKIDKRRYCTSDSAF